MKLFAKVVTAIIHPVTLMVPAVFIIAYESGESLFSSFLWTFIALIFSGVVGGFVLHGVKKGFFKDLDVSVRKQRVILYPFVIGVVFLFMILVHLMKGPKVLELSSIIFIIALFILDLINRKIKASVHVAAISALVIGFIFIYGGWTVFALLLIPLIAWARVVLRRHTVKEVIVGAICGIILSILGIIVVQFII
jgi:hypothetical protein